MCGGNLQRLVSIVVVGLMERSSSAMIWMSTDILMDRESRFLRGVYEQGKGLPRDAAMSANIFKTACESGEPLACQR